MSTILINIETNPREGGYLPNIKYDRFDEITHSNGVKYVAIRDTSGNDPLNRTYWRTLPEMQVEDDWKLGIEGDIDDLEEADTTIRSEFAAADGAVSLALNTKITEKTGYGVATGLVVSAQDTPDMTVKSSGGVVYLPNGDRFAIDAVETIEIADPDPSAARVDIVYVDTNGDVTYLECPPTTPAVAGSKALTVATNAVATDTATVIAVAFTAVAADPAANQFVPGADAAATAVTLGAAIAANATIAAKYDVGVVGAVITLTEKVPGMGDTPADATFTGTLAITNGAAVTSAAAVYPAIAALPTGRVLLTGISVAADATTITDSDIGDKRILLDAVRTAVAAPATTPTRIGDLVIDTETGKAYISVGTSTAADWKEFTFVSAG